MLPTFAAPLPLYNNPLLLSNMLSCTPFQLSNNVHFIHNWRCAGTSINSLLSSNFTHAYLKIGHPFNSFGWPESYQSHRPPLLTLSQLRSERKQLEPATIIVGGHTFNGLQNFLPGNWDIWMNYRDPIQRLNSGILRFYNKKFKNLDS